MQRLLDEERPDILCLNEVKAADEVIPTLQVAPELPHKVWLCSKEKKGYSGVAVFCREKPLRVRKGIGVFDGEGRAIAVELPSLWLLSTYVPNAGQRLERLDVRVNKWDKALLSFVRELEKEKPVVWIGDLNVAHKEIDIHDPVHNRRSAGFTDEERASFSGMLASGLVDVWRERNPTCVQYSYWGYRFNNRASNKGWRLDYAIVSSALVPRVQNVYMRPDIDGSDHCPVGIVIRDV